MSTRFAALLMALTVVPAANAQAVAAQYQAGTDYFLVEPAQPTASGDKVEVIEAFSYACHVCASFQPEVDKWLKAKPADADFVYLPVAWSPLWENLARAYYAAGVLGVHDKTHAAVFDAVHIKRLPMSTPAEIAEWFKTYGVKDEDFLGVMSSFAINAKIARSKNLIPRYGIDGTPAMIVAGKYRITGASAKGYDKVFDVVNFLVAKEAAERKLAAR